ncbi:hypothetical protein Tco_0810748 [Tanacetum coccineum]
MPHDLPLSRVHTLGSDEGRMQHNELMDLVTKLSDRVVALETYLTQTKKVYGADFTKLIKKVKRLEKKDKLSKSRRKLRLMGVSTASIDFTTANVPVTTAGAEISTASPEVKTAGDSVDDIAAESLVYIRRSVAKTKDKGKGIMEESELAITKTKRQQEQERLDLETAVRLQEEFDEEERQRIARVHEAARSFSKVEWEDIRARVEASEELVQRLQTEEREKYSEDDQAKMLQLKRLSFDEIKDLFETTMRRANTFVPMETEIRRGVPELVAGEYLFRNFIIDSHVYYTTNQFLAPLPGILEKAFQKFQNTSNDNSNVIQECIGKSSRLVIIQRFNSTEPTKDKEIEIWVELKRLFEPDADDELWKSQKHIHDITWRLYDTCVECIMYLQRIELISLVEREYPLSRYVLTQMLVAKLLVEQNNEMSRELIRKIFMQIERPRR